MRENKQICHSCGKPTNEEIGFSYAVDDTGKHYCLDCGLRYGLVDPLNYLELHGFGIFHHATYQDGIIYAFRKWGRGYRKYELMFKEVTA